MSTTTDALRVFAERRFFLIHAVRCWRESQFPDIPQLISRCATNLLGPEVERLRPNAICALGRVPHLALVSLWPGQIPDRVVYGRGWQGQIGTTRILITTFPNDFENPSLKKPNKACTADALRDWLSGSDANVMSRLRGLAGGLDVSMPLDEVISALAENEHARVALTASQVAEGLLKTLCAQSQSSSSGGNYESLCRKVAEQRLLSDKAIAYLRTIQKVRNAVAHPKPGDKFDMSDAHFIAGLLASVVQEAKERKRI